MIHSNEVTNNTATLTLQNVGPSNAGIYSASYVGDSPIQGAWMRLIVRGMTEDMVLRHSYTMINPIVQSASNPSRPHTHTPTH